MPMFAAIPLVVSLLAQEPGTGGIKWTDNYQEALAEARRTGKPIFLEFRCEA